MQRAEALREQKKAHKRGLLQQVAPIEVPWMAIIDHSIDDGTKKALVALRIPLAALALPLARSPRCCSQRSAATLTRPPWQTLLHTPLTATWWLGKTRRSPTPSARNWICSLRTLQDPAQFVIDACRDGMAERGKQKPKADVQGDSVIGYVDSTGCPGSLEREAVSLPLRDDMEVMLKTLGNLRDSAPRQLGAELV